MGIPVILLSGLTSCGNVSVAIDYPPVVSLDVDYIELTIEQLNDAYFSSYRTPYETDELFNRKTFVFKNIVIKEYMVRRGVSTHTDEYMVVHSVPVEPHFLVDAFRFEPQDPSVLKRLNVGQVVDIVGEHAGYSLQQNVVVFINCLIEPAGQLPLPFSGAEIMEISGY
jgi:hypothetical protein